MIIDEWRRWCESVCVCGLTFPPFALTQRRCTRLFVQLNLDANFSTTRV